MEPQLSSISEEEQRRIVQREANQANLSIMDIARKVYKEEGPAGILNLIKDMNKRFFIHYSTRFL